MGEQKGERDGLPAGEDERAPLSVRIAQADRAARPRREDAVGLVREPFVPSAKAAAETLEVLAQRGAVAPGDELARLLLALRPAIPLVLGWFAVSSPAYRLARAVELLTAERDRLTKRVAELEAAGRVTASLAKDFAAQAAAEQSVRNWLRAHGHDLTRPWDEVVIGLLEAPPAGSVAGLDHLIRVIVSATAEGIDIGRARAWKEANVEIDRLVAQRAERDAEIARLAAELAEAERLMGAAIDNAAADRERALDAEAKLATARAEGARKEREACAKLCDDAEPCINPADLAYAIRARGDQ